MSGRLSDRLSATIGALGGLVGVMAAPASGSAQDLTPQQMAEYAVRFYQNVQLQNYARIKDTSLKGPRCMPQEAILFDGIIDGEKVLVTVDAPFKAVPGQPFDRRFFETPRSEYGIEMYITPKGAKTTTDPIPKHPDHSLVYTDGTHLADHGLQINLKHPAASVRVMDMATIEEAKWWFSGGYELTKYHVPEGGCHSEGGRLKVCQEGYAVYSPPGRLGGEDMKQPRFSGDYYRKIGHDKLMRRSATELAKADAKYKKYLQVAIKNEMARRKKRAC